MKICYFGPYDRNYPRNHVIREGLKRNGVSVIECCDNERWIWKRYMGLILRYIRIKKDYDAMIVPEFGATNVPLARLLTFISRKPLIFDPFISHYDSNVSDRKLVRKGSFYARYLHFLDKFSCYLADFIFIDTEHQKEYFQQEFGVEEKKLRLIRLGVDDTLFYPRNVDRKEDDFLVLYFGSYSPLTGLEYVLQAAKLLEKFPEIKFKLLGQIPEEIKGRQKIELKNISLQGWVKQDRIPDYIAQADICLGVFGDTDKGRRVIPNRVLQVLAMRKPLITGDTPAVRDILKDKENAILCPLCDSKALAEAILELKNDSSLREKITQSGYKLYLEEFTPDVIGRKARMILEEIISKA